jgi:integrase
VRLQDVTPAGLTRLYVMLRESGRRTPLKRPDGSTDTTLSPRTVRYVHTVLSKALKDAVDLNAISANPAARAKPPGRSVTLPPRPSTWSAEQVTTFLATAAAHPLYPLFVMALTTGMRRGELLGLRWCDLALDGQPPTATIVTTRIRAGGTVASSTPKTRAGNRTLVLDPHTVAVLRAHRDGMCEQRAGLGLDVPGDDAPVFANADGSERDPSSLRMTLHRIARRASVPRIRFHDLRHTYATLALQGGDHPRAVQERLGHDDITTTLRTYSHVMPAVHHQAASTVANLVMVHRPR